MRRIGILFFTLITSSVWLLTHPLVQAQSKDEEFEFWHIAEGYTSEDFSKGINVAHRAFSAPTRELCASSPAPSQFLAREDHIEVTVGEPFSLRDLNIVAIDSEGRILKPIPIRVDTDAKGGLIDYWDFQAGARKDLRALRPDTFRLLLSPLFNGKADSPKLIIHYTIKNK